jgi:two-component system CheB/CheR fusion protein
VPLVVAVAAGDLDAPAELVSALPADCRATFFVGQHLRPSGERLLAAALSERTTLPVIHAHDVLLVEHGHIYVMPPGTTLTLSGGCICVTPDTSGRDHPVDSLFTSLAFEFGDSLIGVILSGGGADGALGIRAIKKGGGTTLAQYPGSARFPNMPISAIETGCVDFVLRPNEIAYELTRIDRAAGVLLTSGFRNNAPGSRASSRAMWVDDGGGRESRAQ